MSSHFGWVDFAGENKNKMLDVVKLFRERDTRDELGIGTIRDAFSNFFFPGTSTIQTRAKYMLFIPWIYKDLEKKKVTYPKIIDRARREEIKLIYSLLKSDDQDGLIGRDAKDNLKRLPSSIYWAGLHSWGILLFPGSQDQYYRSLKSFYKKRALPKEDRNSFQENWDPGLSERPNRLMEKPDLSLSLKEAEYLEDRISCQHNGSLLYYLVNYRANSDIDYFWNLPLINSLPEKLQQNITHGRNFAVTIYGASLLYNYLLAKSSQDLDLIYKYQEKITNWIENIKESWDVLYHWYSNLQDFWLSAPLYGAHIPHSTKTFVERWYKIIFEGKNLENIKDNREAEILLLDRELKLKGKRARLHNTRALEMWQGASGDFIQDYRWGTVKKIISDIVVALTEEENKIA